MLYARRYVASIVFIQVQFALKYHFLIFCCTIFFLSCPLLYPIFMHFLFTFGSFPRVTWQKLKYQKLFPYERQQITLSVMGLNHSEVVILCYVIFTYIIPVI